MITRSSKNSRYFLIIASDYKPMPGGIGEFIDNLARGIMENGNKVKILGIVHPNEPNEHERIEFLKSYEEWVSPFEMKIDPRHNSRLRRKCVSLLEIMRCLALSKADYLEKKACFRDSSQEIAKIGAMIASERPNMAIFGHLDRRLYPIALLFKKMNVPYGIIAHDYEIRRGPIYKINDLIVKGKMIHGASWMAANSEHTKSFVEKWMVPGNRIIILHPPVSKRLIMESTGSCSSVKDPVFTLLTICRIVKNKGIDIVLRALKILEEKEICCRYIIAGNGSERPHIESLIRELGIKSEVQFLGYIEDEAKSSIYCRADVYVMPSRVNPRLQHEGFGLAFIEAAVFGIPGVGSRAGGIPDAIVHGETGLLVPPESPEELAKALIFLYQNPKKRKELGKAAMERARTKFSPTRIAEHFQNELLRIIQ